MTTQLTNYAGKIVANHYVITNDKGSFLQSYTTIVAQIDKDKKLTLSPKWNVSNIERKYLYIFLTKNGLEQYSKKTSITDGIENGNIKVVDTIKTI